MEIKVSADGEITLNVTNGETDKAVDLIRALRCDAQRAKTSANRSKSMAEAAQKVDDSELNQLQYRTWEFLCENDNPDGVHVSQLAKAFGLNRAAANTRLVVLTNMGYAKRVHKGYYRALTPEAA
jgi:hypothetical protein